MRSFKHQRQSGFTLIELVIVIVIIGILAAVAIPKYLDLATEAKQAKVDGVAGTFAGAAATNFAICSGLLASPSCKNAGVIACTAAGAALVMDSVPTDVAFAATEAGLCTVTMDTGAIVSKAVVIKSL